MTRCPGLGFTCGIELARDRPRGSLCARCEERAAMPEAPKAPEMKPPRPPTPLSSPVPRWARAWRPVLEALHAGAHSTDAVARRLGIPSDEASLQLRAATRAGYATRMSTRTYAITDAGWDLLRRMERRAA
jgi:hypothetical protein